MPTYIKSNVDATVNVISEAIQSADYTYENEELTLTYAGGTRLSLIHI